MNAVSTRNTGSAARFGSSRAIASMPMTARKACRVTYAMA
jgi:hypothetical protein